MGFANTSDYMARAAELAQKGMGHTRPNPSVGAVVVNDGKIVGEGWHRKAGGDHAEVAALKNAGDAARGSTVYVTLEPCSKPGRVGACTDALVASGVAKVVYAVEDPNPKNRGKAASALAKAGIACEKYAGDEGVMRRCEELIAPFRKHILTGLPYVTVKIAMSLDGRICDDYGNAKWISSDAARGYTGSVLRERNDAIMVGGETVRRDNPSLLSHGTRNDDLVRVVVSRSGELPKDAKIFTDGAPNKTLVYDDARKALEELGRQGITSVLCEGGMKLAVSLAKQGLVDKWIAVLAPKVIGHGKISEATIIGEVECLLDS